MTLLAVEQCLWAVALFCAGAVLVLLLGAQILDWYWPVSIALASLAFGLIRVRRRRRSPYELAQIVDRRLSLHDTLSTACYFQENPHASRSVQMLSLQSAQAAQLVDSLTPQLAVPFTLPRAAYTAAASLALVIALVGVRYGVLRSLDMQRSLAPGSLDFLSMLVRGERPLPPTAEDSKSQVADDAAEARQKDPEYPESVYKDVQGFSLNQSSSNRAANAAALELAEASESQVDGGERQLADGNQDSRESSQGASSAQRPAGDALSRKNGEKKRGNEAKSPNDEKGSLLDRMRDAFNNLMAKMDVQDGKADRSQAGSSAQSDFSNQEGSDDASEKGSLAPGKTGVEGLEARDADSNGQGDKKMNASKQKSERASSQTPKDSNSGIGSSDGDKTLRLAEQQKAMGKISEILGRRSLDLTGEVTVEVTNAGQALKTRYTKQSARPSQPGGEVRRDAIPLEYQPYVRKYFEQIRKLPAATKTLEPKDGQAGSAGEQ